MDDVGGILFHGSEVKECINLILFSLGNSHIYQVKCGLYINDNNTKYSITVNSKDEFLYGKNL